MGLMDRLFRGKQPVKNAVPPVVPPTAPAPEPGPDYLDATPEDLRELEEIHASAVASFALAEQLARALVQAQITRRTDRLLKAKRYEKAGPFRVEVDRAGPSPRIAVHRIPAP